jgi:hypothetical protein
VKVSEVAKLLEGIAKGLEELSKKTADGLSALQLGMQPFAEQTVEQFLAFLGQCAEYQRTGTVAAGRKRAAPKPKAPIVTVAAAAGQVRELLAEMNKGTVTTLRIDTLLGDLKKALTKAHWEQLLAALEIAGKPKTKDQAVDKVRQVLNSQLAMYVKAQAFDVPG